jgi:diaminopimelate decarboxylase
LIGFFCDRDDKTMKESYIYHTLDDGDDISIEETSGYHLFNEAMI